MGECQRPVKTFQKIVSWKITRSKAKEIFLNHIMGDIPDDQLESFLDDILYHRLYNAVIVPDHETENDDSII